MNAREDYNQGIAEQKQENYDAALSSFKRAFEKFTEPTDKAECLFRCGSIYADLGTSLTMGDELLSYVSEKKRKQIQQHLKNAILYFNKALNCWEKWQSGSLTKKGLILFNRAEMYDALGEHQKAHDDYTLAYGLSPDLAHDNVTTFTKLTNLVIHFPELYQNTLRALLLPNQLDYVKKIYLPQTTLEGFERVIALLPQDADRNTKLQIYLDCAVGYRNLGDNFSFSKDQRQKHRLHYRKAIQYYNFALKCLEGLDNAALKGGIFLNLGQLCGALDEHQNAHDNYTAAYNANPHLAKVTATDYWLKHYIKRYPAFYENTFEPLLSKEQKEAAQRIKLEIQKPSTKKKFQAFKTKIPLFSTSNSPCENKSEPERPDQGSYFLLSDDQQKVKKFH